MPPLQIDFARQMKIGRGVFVNPSLTCMAAGGNPAKFIKAAIK